MMDKSLSAQLKSAGRITLILFIGIVMILLVVYVLSGIYTVKNNEVGVHLHLGKIVDSRVPPGMHYAWPWPFDMVKKVPMPKVEKIEINDFSERFTFGAEGFSFTSLTGLGTYAITGDNNLVNLSCVIQYEVLDPEKYLFNLGDKLENVDAKVKRFLIEMACNTILHCFAEISVDQALTSWELIIDYIKMNLQKRLDEIESGLRITFIEVRELKPPSVVQEYFDDVINAKIDKEKMINDAISYQNEEIPAANGRAARLRSEGEAYRNEVVQNATGESGRFLDQLSEYVKNPELNRYRLYMEAIQEVFIGVERAYILDTSTGSKPAKIKLFK